MIRETFEQPSIPEVLASQSRARDKFMICDVGGLVQAAREAGSEYPAETADRLERGVPHLIEKSDKFLQKFEDLIFLGHGWTVHDSVVGAVPNVPALLAGSPYGMRVRQRVRSPQAPLTMLLELTGSGGTQDWSRAQRGAAMLALARLLSNTRAVEVWILVTLGERGYMNMVACRVDTAPLHLGHASVLLCDNLTLTGIVETNRILLNDSKSQSWSYGSTHMERTWSGEALRRVITPGSELLFIPAAYLSDNFRDPERWVRDMLAKYGMGAIPRDDE